MVGWLKDVCNMTGWFVVVRDVCRKEWVLYADIESIRYECVRLFRGDDVSLTFYMYDEE